MIKQVEILFESVRNGIGTIEIIAKNTYRSHEIEREARKAMEDLEKLREELKRLRIDIRKIEEWPE